MIEKLLFALGSVIAFEGFFLAIIPERLKKTLSQISIISNKHCNFIINENNASATDIETLGEIVRKKVFEKTGKKLKWEIKIVGEK